jgi:hypothetical protein
MNIRGHKWGATAVTTLVIACTWDPLFIPGIILGSCLPDIDADYSYIKRGPLKLYSKLPKCRLFGFGGRNHRSLLFHSFYTLIGVAALSYYFQSKLILGLLFGIMGHHILDWKIPRYWRL